MLIIKIKHFHKCIIIMHQKNLNQKCYLIITTLMQIIIVIIIITVPITTSRKLIPYYKIKIIRL